MIFLVVWLLACNISCVVRLIFVGCFFMCVGVVDFGGQCGGLECLVVVFS